MIWTIFPVCTPLAVATIMDSSSPPVATGGLWACELLQRRGPGDDLRQLGRDLRLAGAVVFLAQLADDVVGVVGGGLHRHAAGDLFAHRRVEEALEQPHLKRHG